MGDNWINWTISKPDPNWAKFIFDPNEWIHLGPDRCGSNEFLFSIFLNILCIYIGAIVDPMWFQQESNYFFEKYNMKL